MGLPQFRVMTFVLANAPDIFQQPISIVLSKKGVSITYLGYILVFSETLEENFDHLRLVLGHLRRQGLKY